jgi:3-phosphoshikimate 1-carboxyvinyltransferase
MNAKIEISRARGAITVPPSKSVAHRLLISAALSYGETTEIFNLPDCDDVVATIGALTELGASFERREGSLVVHGADMKKALVKNEVFCNESGSTLRFLIPIALLSGNSVTFTGAGKLMERPHKIYADIAKEKGYYYSQCDGKITVKGPLVAGEYTLPGNVSSQFITGLLFALSTLSEDSKIIIKESIESRSYIDLTLSAMAQFGVSASWLDERTLYVKGAQRYRADKITVEGDYSASAFVEALNLFGGEVIALGLSVSSLQGDRVYRDIFPKLSDGFTTVDITNCPDLAPILFAVAAAKHGAEFVGTKRLKIKESDRAEAMANELSKLGASLEVYENRVVVSKASLHKPSTTLSGYNDHRIVMALSVLLTTLGGEIGDAEAVSKSYPDFFDHLLKLGIKVSLYEA